MTNIIPIKEGVKLPRNEMEFIMQWNKELELEIARLKAANVMLLMLLEEKE